MRLVFDILREQNQLSFISRTLRSFEFRTVQFAAKYRKHPRGIEALSSCSRLPSFSIPFFLVALALREEHKGMHLCFLIF